MSTDLEVLEGDLLPTSAAALASQSPAAVYLARLATGSRSAQQRALELIADALSGGRFDAEHLPWATLRYEHTSALRSYLVERQAPATVNRHLSALRGVLEEAWNLGQMTAEDYHRAASVKNVKGSRLPAGRHVDDGELVALVGACRRDASPAGVRDAALLAVSFTGGLRLAELVGLDVADFNEAEGSLRLVGKGNKERTTYLQNGGLAALTAWLELRGAEPGPLFCPVSQTGEIKIRRMTGQAVYMRFRKRAKEATVAGFSPHDGRRTFIGNLLDRGADISTVQKLAGHESVSTTQRYDRRPEAAKKQATALLHFPY